jgi:NAD(P)-dependent dehydrogenase (short-subunit alcohol dehydrogenase family)
MSFEGQVVFVTGGGSGMGRLAAGLVWSMVHRVEGR